MARTSTCKLRVSVVVPVFNRVSETHQLLAALSQQHMPAEEYEVLLCDDGSTKDLAAAINDFQKGSELSVRYFRQSNQGAGSARNLGLTHAASSIVAFTDTDCIPDRDWLRELIGPIETSDVQMTGGSIDFRTAEYLSGRCVNFLMSSMLGAGGARDPRSVVHMKYYPRAGNVAVDRDLARSVGGFPNQGHGEDIAFSHRMITAGARVRFVPTATVVHNEKRTMWQVATEAFRKGIARIRLSETQGVHEWVHAIPALLVLGLTGGLSLGLLFPAAAKVAATPFMLYGAAVAFVSLQGGFILKDLRAAMLLPIYTVLLHFGYGIGYLFAYIKDGQPPVAAERVPLASPDLWQIETDTCSVSSSGQKAGSEL